MNSRCKSWLSRLFTLGLTGLLFALPMDTRAGEIDFVESYALAADRAQVLKQLIPGTENYYYYNCLYLIQTEQLDKCADLARIWRERLGETPLWRQIQHRHTFLSYRKAPRPSLDYLIKHLGLNFDQQRQVPGAKTTLPTTLDTKAISRDTLRQQFITPQPHVDLAEEQALRWLAAEKLSPEQRHSLLNRLQRPDLPNLVELILADLDFQNSGGFGSDSGRRSSSNSTGSCPAPPAFCQGLTPTSRMTSRSWASTSTGWSRSSGRLTR